MSELRHILFIMCDQLRRDYLGCYGHPHLETPNIDALAADGVRFGHAYVQSTICGPSRMSFYTGRYMSTHGSTWNGVPLNVGERGLGEYLSPVGWRTVLAGKTHMRADHEGMDRLGVDPASIIGVQARECGFEIFERDDGLHPSSTYDADPAYDAYLRALGFDAENPWQDWANSGTDPDTGEVMSGWYLKNANLAARIPEEHSETPYMTRRAMRFIEGARDERWCLHLSYIKPHWPYIVPAPYHDMYETRHLVPPVRSEAERLDPHPVYGAFMQHRDSRVFAQDHARERVLPAYMGLIRQIDDQLGVLFAFLKDQGLWDDTLIVFTSDHGDYLGDHWLGEKELFHDCSVRIPLIIRDPRPAADATRGTVCDALVEAIDLVPTFIDYAGGHAQPHRLEGLSLRPWLEGGPPPPRDHAVSEMDYGRRDASRALGLSPGDARTWMVRTHRWKYIHHAVFRPQLYDLQTDPLELNDLGADPAHAEQCSQMKDRLLAWSLGRRTRTTISDESVLAMRDGADQSGILIGWWDENG